METEIKFVPAKIEIDDPMIAFQVAVAQARELGKQFERAAKELLSYPADTFLKRGILKMLRSSVTTFVINPPDSNNSRFVYKPEEADFFNFGDQVCIDGIVIEYQQSPEEKFTIFKKIKAGRHFNPSVKLTKEKIAFAIPEDPSEDYPEYLEVPSRHNVFSCTIKTDGWNRDDPALFEGQPGMEEVRSITDIVKEITGRARLFFSQS